MTATAERSRVREVTPAEAKAWIDRGQATLIDVREPDEVVRERIAGSRVIPLSRFDSTSLPEGRLVLHCASGKRSLEAAARAQGRDEVYTLAGGIKGWKAAGLPTERRAVPISIMRQVQITAGTVVLVCSVLALAVSVWFAVVPAFMGAGLLFAGASGTCGMAAMLRLMPWNAALRCGE
jgi:rhodanese-related sulfurtransferase